jgi:nucleotide-binding universal stress UspA family protein
VYKKIAAGLDGSDGSWQAVDTAIALARLDPEAEIWVISVVERLPHMPELIDELEEEKSRANTIFDAMHKKAAAIGKAAGVQIWGKTIAGHAAQGIVRFAEEGEFDLLVIGHSGHSNVWGRFLGSTADKIVRHAPCDVLVVR